MDTENMVSMTLTVISSSASVAFECVAKEGNGREKGGNV